MFEIIEILDVGNDVLLVRALDADGLSVEARGHVSATTNHFDADAYDADGNRRENKKGAPLVQPREMTPDEVGAYALRLLDEQNPQAGTAVAFRVAS